MADTKKKAAKKGTPKEKRDPKPKEVDLAAEEKRLQGEYPDRHIVKGSIRDAGAVPEFGNKRTVEIKCAGDGCKKTRRVATSDLHQVGHCEDCIKSIRLQRRKDARASTSKKKPKTASAGPKAKTKPGKKPQAKKKVEAAAPAHHEDPAAEFATP